MQVEQKIRSFDSNDNSNRHTNYNFSPPVHLQKSLKKVNPI